MTHKHNGRDYLSGDHCPHCWKQACEVIQEQLDKARAENTELRHALTDARAVIQECVNRMQPLLPFILAQTKSYDDKALERFEREAK